MLTNVPRVGYSLFVVAEESISHPNKQTEPEPARPKKKPYHKPDFQYERVFETMALSCGKLPGHFRCAMNKKLS